MTDGAMFKAGTDDLAELVHNAMCSGRPYRDRCRQAAAAVRAAVAQRAPGEGETVVPAEYVAAIREYYDAAAAMDTTLDEDVETAGIQFSAILTRWEAACRHLRQLGGVEPHDGDSRALLTAATTASAADQGEGTG